MDGTQQPLLHFRIQNLIGNVRLDIGGMRQWLLGRQATDALHAQAKPYQPVTTILQRSTQS